ncbi:MAG: VOC family protein [Xanthomonadales bacterium]|nr:VOC family protein [Xanthomonadales bacterium]
MSQLCGSRHVLAVPQLSRSVEYYCGVLGFNQVGADSGWAFLRRDAVVLMLGECPDALAPAALGDHNYFGYFHTDDAQALLQSFSERGVELVKPLTDEAWGMREFGIRTIDGHRIMFGQPLAEPTTAP